MGAGHDGAAHELAQRLEARGTSASVVDFLDASPRLGRALKWVYELWLARAPWAYEATYRMWVVLPLLCRPLVAVLDLLFGRKLRRWASDSGASTIVSTYPLASVVLGHQRKRRLRPLRVPVITFVTDFATHPLWVHKGVDLHLCVHERAAESARSLSGGESRATGPMVRAAFFSPPGPLAELRERFAIPERARVVLVVAGSWGVGELEQTFDDLSADPECFPIVVCGSNAALAARLRDRERGLVLGWTDQMPALMHASDVLVQNAGGLTSMEAFACGLPVVTYRPLAGHGRDNAGHMAAAGVAPLAPDRSALHTMIASVVAEREEMASRGRALFKEDPAVEVARLASVVVPLRAPQPHPALRRVAAGATGLAVGIAALNVASEAAMATGLGSAHPAPNSRAIGIGVRLSPAAAASATLRAALADDHVTAVVDGSTAAVAPAAVRGLRRAGIQIANGGWGSEPRLHLLGQSVVARSTRALTSALGTPVHVYVPGQPMSGVDLVVAKLEHDQIVSGARRVTAGRPLPQLYQGKTYVVSDPSGSPAALLTSLSLLVAQAQSDGLAVGPLTYAQ